MMAKNESSEIYQDLVQRDTGFIKLFQLMYLTKLILIRVQFMSFLTQCQSNSHAGWPACQTELILNHLLMELNLTKLSNMALDHH